MLKEGCLELGLTSLIAVTMAKPDTLNFGADYYSIVLAWVTIPILIMTPICLYVLSTMLISLMKKKD